MELLRQLGQMTEIHSGSTVSAKEIQFRVEARVQNFVKQGLLKNDRVLLRHGNSISFFIDLFALWTLDACAIPLDRTTPEQELQKIAVHSSASFEIQTDYGPLLRIGDVRPTTASIHLILYTSGSMGLPKGVTYNLTTLENKLAVLEENLPIEDFQKSLCLLPTHFGHGLIGNSLFPLLRGCHLYIGPPFDLAMSEKLSSLIDFHEITFFSSVPSFWNFLKDHHGLKRSSLKRIHCASSLFLENAYLQIRKWAPSAKIFNVYGLTEFASWVSGFEVQQAADFKYVGMGWGADFKIENSDESGVGVVLIKSKAEMIGYLNQPDLTEKSRVNGWFRTGDLGFVDKKNGLKLIGRYDDLMNVGGAKIVPSEIENVLLKNSSLRSVCVFSIPHVLTGEAIVAAYMNSSNVVTPAELERWCQEYLPKYRIPTYWYPVQQIPETSRGKVDRRNLRESFLQKYKLLNNQQHEKSDIEKNFEKTVRKVFNLTDDVNLQTLSYGSSSNWDSIRHIELFIKIKKIFNVSFSTDEIVGIENYETLRRTFLQKVSAL
jgi:acyl-CoA synthetase (AMP-forming)/AMP-acid ligase II/acyl carrier protein